jgi:large repetitive protein
VTPTVAWNAPAAITYGTGLGASQLDATARVPGLFAYTPAAGTVIGAGVHTLSVTFTPNDSTDYAPLTVTTGITVARATPTVSVSDGGGTYDGSPFAATAEVVGLGNQTGPSLEGVSPTLSYYAGSSATGTPMVGAPSAVGTYTVVAVFPGSGDYAGAESAPVTFEITAPPAITASSTTVTLTSSAGSTVYGETVTLAADVTSTNPGAGTPTGTVTFFDGSSQLGAVTLDGSGRATLTVSSLALGGHSITAVYGGETAFLGGQSGAVSQSVTPDGTAVVLVPHAVLKKKKVVSLTLTAQVEPLAPGGGVPTGVVTFRIKKKTLGTVALVGGQGTLPVKSSSVLNKPITVIYGGGGDFQSSTLASTRLTSRSLARPAHSLARKAAHPTAPSRAISRKLRKI